MLIRHDSMNVSKYQESILMMLKKWDVVLGKSNPNPKSTKLIFSQTQSRLLRYSRRIFVTEVFHRFVSSKSDILISVAIFRLAKFESFHHQVTNIINPYWQIMENSSRNFSGIFIFRVVTQTVLLDNSSIRIFGLKQYMICNIWSG